MRSLGATDAFNLDGGGSTELVARDTDDSAVTVRNHPSGGAERPVPNGIGVFHRLSSGRFRAAGCPPGRRSR